MSPVSPPRGSCLRLRAQASAQAPGTWSTLALMVQSLRDGAPVPRTPSRVLHRGLLALPGLRGHCCHQPCQALWACALVLTKLKE